MQIYAGNSDKGNVEITTIEFRQKPSLGKGLWRAETNTMTILTETIAGQEGNNQTLFYISLNEINGQRKRFKKFFIYMLNHFI